MDRKGEREQTSCDVSKVVEMTSKPGWRGCPGMSLGATCLLPRRCPAWSWRESGSGSGVERGNLRPDTATVQLDQ